MTDERDETKAKPFLKWAGGKRAMLPVLRPYFPERFGTYYEPFLGGGAVFFALAPSRAVVSDSNERLVRTYEAVRDHADQVVDFLARSPNDEAFFRKVRQFKGTAADTASIGASTIYLNRTCFNGLWRVNGKGEFNVPFGKYKNPSICDEPNLRACSAALKSGTLLAADFETALSGAQPGDFAYCDPPYLPISPTASFTSGSARRLIACRSRNKRSVKSRHGGVTSTDRVCLGYPPEHAPMLERRDDVADQRDARGGASDLLCNLS